MRTSAPPWTPATPSAGNHVRRESIEPLSILAAVLLELVVHQLAQHAHVLIASSLFASPLPVPPGHLLDLPPQCRCLPFSVLLFGFILGLVDDLLLKALAYLRIQLPVIPDCLHHLALLQS